MKISVIVLGYNNKELTLDCLNSLMVQDYPIYEIVYVDNNSSDGVVLAIHQKFPFVKTIRLFENRLYAGGMNVGIMRSEGDIFLCLNNDTNLDRSCIREICAYMQDKQIGCANPKIITDGSDKSISKLKCFGLIPYTVSEGEPDYANGCAMILNRKALAEVGLFDMSLGMYFEDVDLSLRMKKAGYKIGFISKAIVWHKGGASVKKIPWKTKWYVNRNRLKMLFRYGGRK